MEVTNKEVKKEYNLEKIFKKLFPNGYGFIKIDGYFSQIDLPAYFIIIIKFADLT